MDGTDETTKRVLATSLYTSEQATDVIMSRLGSGVAAAVRAHTEDGQPITQDQYQAIMADVDAELQRVYGRSRRDADRAELGGVVVAECHNARKRMATHVLRRSVFPALRRDRQLREHLGTTESQVQ